jgi:hypothetical protein
MQELLTVKGETGGKNTARYPGKNISIGMKQLDGRVGILFAVGEDNMMDYEGVRVSWIDMMHAFRDDPALSRSAVNKDTQRGRPGRVREIPGHAKRL